MILKFRLGLFEKPYADPALAKSVVGAPEFRKEAEAAQRRAQVVLENRDATLPVNAGKSKVWLYGVNADVLVPRVSPW